MAVYTEYVGNWRGDLDASLNAPNGGQTEITLLARIGRKGTGTLNTYTFACQFGTSQGGSQYGTVSGELNKAGWTTQDQVRQFGSQYITTVSRTHEPQTFSYWGRFKAVDVSGWHNTSQALVVTVPPKDTYPITYDANGGTGAPANQSKWYNEDITLQSGTPTRSGFKFIGWATTPNAVTASYQPSQTYAADAPLALYAVWKQTMQVKENGTWYGGEVSVKVGGSWHGATGIYVKESGSWHST